MIIQGNTQHSYMAKKLHEKSGEPDNYFLEHGQDKFEYTREERVEDRIPDLGKVANKNMRPLDWRKAIKEQESEFFSVTADMKEKTLTVPNAVKSAAAEGKSTSHSHTKKTEDDWDKLDVLKNDFARIISDKTSSPLEKSIARFGIDIDKLGATYEYNKDKLKAGNIAMKALKNSPEGKGAQAIAQVSAEAAGALDEDSEKLDILKNGFSCINSSEVSSPTEKSIAQFGINIDKLGSTYEYDKDKLKAGNIAMKALKTPPEGKGTQVIAQVAAEAAGALDEDSEKLDVLKNGFSCINSSEASSPTEKSIAQFGINIDKLGSTYEYDKDKLKAGNIAMKALKTPPEGKGTQVIAQVAAEAAGALDEDSEKLDVLKNGFSCINSSEASSPTEKSIAQFGIDIDKLGATYEYDKDKLKSGNIAMKALKTPPEGKGAQILAQVATDAAGTLDEDWEKSNILGNGFKNILNNPEVTDKEKELASFGLDVDYLGATYRTDSAEARIKEIVMNGIKTSKNLSALEGEIKSAVSMSMDEIKKKIEETKKELEMLEKNVRNTSFSAGLDGLDISSDTGLKDSFRREAFKSAELAGGPSASTLEKWRTDGLKFVEKTEKEKNFWKALGLD